MTLELIEKLQFLADKYETKDFLEKDPSQFMHHYDSVVDQEIVAFIAANLAFGRRDQILSHVQMIEDQWKNRGLSPLNWVLSEAYKSFFNQGEKSFYRMYTHTDMILFFDTLKMMLQKEGSLGEYVKKQWMMTKGTAPSVQYLHQTVASIFPIQCKLLPHSKDSAAKKVNMLLRWLVRDDSPVDLGLWTWYDKSKLLMPLDTHVLQESVKFGILEGKKTKGTDPSNKSKGSVPSGTLKTAISLTSAMKEAFPGDPVRGDFALFGLGVDN